MEFTLLFAAALGFGAGWVALRWEAARGNAVECSRDLWDILIGAGVVGLLVGRLAAMISTGVNPLASFGDILIVRGGVATGPATIGALLAVAVMARGEIVIVADALAVAALASIGGWHLGCMMREACLGTTTDVPWAMTQSGSQVGRHPVELYAAGIFILAAAGLAVARKRPIKSGVAASIALLILAIGRLATEPFRLSLSGGPVWWYAAGAVIGLGALMFAARASR